MNEDRVEAAAEIERPHVALHMFALGVQRPRYG